jgi:hypothetical protein
MVTALQAGSRALTYYVQAGAYDRMGDFASSVVTSTSDPHPLAGLLPYLETATEAAPEGRSRWCCLGILADALMNGGHPDASLSFYEKAATLANTDAETQGENGREAWADVGWITGNWAGALRMNGDLNSSRQLHLSSAEAAKKAAMPAIKVIGRELEALRIDILQDQAKQALPQLEQE